jgi:glycosyltransferase involved in cell wall biosynthesis
MRIAFVVQRYGVEVSGGAETLARRVANLLADDVELTVLTTCALDYVTWENHYPPGEATVEGVRVLRFPVDDPRDPSFDEISRRAYASPDDLELGRAWMQAQGPNSSGLLEHLRDEGETYDAVAFVTYLYAPTANGLPLVASRSVLVPAVHDEPPLRLRLFDQVFADARILLFSTPEERELARVRFGVEDNRSRIVGLAIDDPPDMDGSRFSADRGLGRAYALYVGRLDLSKGVGDLVEAHRIYREAQPDGLDLVLMGSGSLDVDEPWIHQTGFVSESEKHDALAGATIVVLPSPYESLSIVQLEAWSHGRPTLSNARSPILVGQSRRSGGGLWYAGAEEYAEMLDFLVRTPPIARTLGREGRRFVSAAYSWGEVREGWLAALQAATLPSAITQAAG